MSLVSSHRKIKKRDLREVLVEVVVVMDGEERCRELRCSGGAQDTPVINMTMLRFRPIAPKPATGSSGSAELLMYNKNLFLSNKRSKRKYVRVRKNNGYRRKKRLSDQETEKEKEDSSNKKIVTLQFLPERSDVKESPTRGPLVNHFEEDHQDPPMWLNFKNPVIGDMESSVTEVVVMAQRRVLETWVTVESVTTDTCMDAQVLGSTDMERMKNLEVDMCPGFLSDGLNRVQWMNGAYKRMVTVSKKNDTQTSSSSSSSSSPEITVWLVIKEKLPYMYTAFTCKVRLQYTWQNEKYSQMVPCDVWRMDCGGFAWRLDIESALSLGR